MLNFVLIFPHIMIMWLFLSRGGGGWGVAAHHEVYIGCKVSPLPRRPVFFFITYTSYIRTQCFEIGSKILCYSFNLAILCDHYLDFLAYLKTSLVSCFLIQNTFPLNHI